MIVIAEDLIINIFVKVDNFYKRIIPLIPKLFIEYSNNDINKKKKKK